MDTPTTYVVTDIEADGLTLGVNSMISFASVAVGEDGADHGRLTINLKPFEGSRPDPGAIAWWQTNPEAWAEATRDPVEPTKAMTEFADWVRSLPGRAVFAAHPLIFDGTWMAWYVERFAGLPLFDRHRQPGLMAGGIDLATLVMGVHGWSFEACRLDNYPEEWFGGHIRTHAALDDALGYAHLLKELLSSRKIK
ncbi:hypothetical protein ABN028_34405 [Actinopolymorpha sp. B17G11]|uniref:hypothetical protein n=1 Tax=Actinopolymorpha sp. B17G11 TaxID=3160861 RepID=UPI0032E4BFEF